MNDQLTDLSEKLACKIREYIGADLKSTQGLETFLYRELAPYLQQTPAPTKNSQQKMPRHPPETIAFKALDRAKELDMRAPREAILGMLAQVILALHRQAEALEATSDWLDEINTELHMRAPGPN